MADSIINNFSGKGNSLYIARELKRRPPEGHLQSILSMIKNGELAY